MAELYLGDTLYPEADSPLLLPPEITLENTLALRESAKAVLDHNDRGLFVTPSDQLYGAGNNNWGYLWDTAFITMAIAQYDAPRAANLFANFISTQHSNGRIPHMAMWSSDFPIGSLATNVNWHGWRFQQQDRHGNRVKTSPITQPPILAMAAGEIMDALPTDQRKRAFAHVVAPQLIKYHSWLYSEREVKQSGLVATIHPHETGRDDAPSHIDLLHAMPLSGRQKMWLTQPVQRLIAANRTDKAANPSERSDTDTVMRAAGLAIFGLPRTYRSNIIPAKHPYQHLDPGFNAILDRSNDELIRVANWGGISVSTQLQEAMDRTSEGLQAFWDPRAQAFRGLDVHERISLPAGEEIGDLLPIISRNITGEQRLAIAQKLLDPNQFGGDSLPSVNRRSKRYDSARFWQGADWPQIRQLIMTGLYENGGEAEYEVANRLGQAALRSALDGQFAEYRDGTTGAAKGARNFSWAAGLVLYASRQIELPDLETENVA